jgi:ADP-heptose:LPS heptosyltransferase
MNKLSALVRRHVQAFWYVLTILLPVIIRTGRRPVIFSRFAGMGDIIGTIPAALELKRRHAGATFIYNCHNASACIPRMGGVTNNITGFRHIGLVSYWYSWLLTGFYEFSSDDDDLKTDDTENSIVAFGRRVGVKTSEAHPRLEISVDLHQQAQTILSKNEHNTFPLIVLHTGPSSPVRQWPRDAWVKLVQALKQQGYYNIIQLGARAGSYAHVSPVETEPLPGVFPLTEQLTLEQSLAIISLADLYIGIDSGLLHAAISLQIIAIGIWGPTTPHFRFSENERRWFITSSVECQGCHHRIPRLHWETGCPFEIKCMKTISAESVLETCLAVLREKNHK